MSQFSSTLSVKVHISCQGGTRKQQPTCFSGQRSAWPPSEPSTCRRSGSVGRSQGKSWAQNPTLPSSDEGNGHLRSARVLRFCQKRQRGQIPKGLFSDPTLSQNSQQDMERGSRCLLQLTPLAREALVLRPGSCPGSFQWPPTSFCRALHPPSPWKWRASGLPRKGDPLRKEYLRVLGGVFTGRAPEGTCRGHSGASSFPLKWAGTGPQAQQSWAPGGCSLPGLLPHCWAPSLLRHAPIKYFLRGQRHLALPSNIVFLSHTSTRC